MQVEREDIVGLLGPRAPARGGVCVEFAMAGSTRRARIEVGEDGSLYADVTEGDVGDAVEVVVLRGGPDGVGGYQASGRDGSGEASDARDPRAAAAAWRRLVAPMAPVA